MTPIATTLVAGTAPLGKGGLGGAAAEFTAGLEALGHLPTYSGPQAANLATRAAGNRAFRRLFGTAPSRRLKARAVRRAVPREGWDLVYAMPGSVPVEHAGGVCVIHQATRHPALEWAAL